MTHLRPSLITFLLCVSAALCAAEPKEVRVGLIDTFDPEFYLSTFVPTIEHLQKTLKDYRVKVIEIESSDLAKEIQSKRPDFLISSAGSFVSLINQTGAQQIATVRRSNAINPEEAVSSVFVVRADREDLQRIEDLKGKTVSASDPTDFDGYLLALGEVAARGFNPDTFFQKTLFSHYRYPDVITYVKVGAADAGILGPCQLENLIQLGQIRPDELRVLNPKGGASHCARSTDMYPDAVFFSLDGAPSFAVKAVALSLLSMPEQSRGFEWVPAGGFLKVFDLMKSLKLGPYEHLRETTLKAFILQHRTEILLAIALLFAIGVHIVRVNVLVNRRTNELKYALAVQRATEKKAERNRQRLDLLEKNRVISQMSSMFAHEVKQPITNIIYYSSGLKMLLANLGVSDERVNLALDKLCRQAKRTADIVDHVRSYAKHTANRSEVFDLTPTAQRALGSIREDERYRVEILTDLPASALVLGDSFEIELVILNLLKNAVKAAQLSDHPQITLKIEDTGSTWTVSVSDNGPEISAEVFSQLGKPTQSQKKEGLGIGLSIVVDIIENYSSHLNFQRVKPHGLWVSFSLKKAKEKDKEESEP